MAEDNLDISTSLYAHRRKSGPMKPDERKKAQEKFLKAYGELGIIKYACRVAKINRKTFYDWKQNDPEFAALLPDTTDDANDTLEYAAYVQAVEGTDEPALSMGRLVYEEELVLDEDGNPVLDKKGRPITKRGKQIMIKKYSPQLLITLLKARMPEKYKDKMALSIQTLPKEYTQSKLDELEGSED